MLWNMKLTVIVTVVRTFGTLLKELEKKTLETGDQKKNQDHPSLEGIFKVEYVSILGHLQNNNMQPRVVIFSLFLHLLY